MRTSEEYREILKESALLHDIGKIGIPENILNKTGKLTDEEYEPTRTQRAEYRKQINDLQAAIETLETTEGQVVDNE